ncbi:DUF2515 family protein [Virgibacillus oceani]|uniref:DUF2515 domain-containing protein n=1 Tax=Virgibacillus oceani TaxID=1479511 RepID=A0A917H2K1_9BACI|nr:DUF2515 family protein [Virgibacillus oceani]GGG65549.1 hypothetical protein GCM10011398_06520 [Virgibacillus oceani]
MHQNISKQDYIHYIIMKTKSHNVDNITRTKAYQNFYMENPEIQWTLVASLVSRNAGWNMTDLSLKPYKKLLHHDVRNRFFMTYERANWLIFSDAYPQLLVYKLSKKVNTPLFFLLKNFHVSSFIINEWYKFWHNHDKQRLLVALIINEQNVIQSPVIKQPYFKYQVFFKLPYLLQDLLLMNAIVLPTKNQTVYGAFVHDFTNLTNRITLGKRVSAIIFNPRIYQNVLDFLLTIEHTGSRWDYEKFLDLSFPKSTILRLMYPVVTHQDIVRNDWYKWGGIKSKWFKEVSYNNNTDRDAVISFYKKRSMLFSYYHLKNSLTAKKDL